MGKSETTGRRLAWFAPLGWRIGGAIAVGLLMSGLYILPAADAGGETRTMTLYSVNTKEKLTTTYMVNGRHVGSELTKINHLLRDWRRNAVTKIDPRTIDLMWELHADLGSRAPIHIISGYRSAETNGMLKNIGRNVAKRSMHIQGKAIDLFFPDVPTERLRNSALVRDVGGVGYYPRSGASGFVHVDSGRVRHWPGIGKDQIARIRREYVRTVGARLGRGQAVQIAAAEAPSQIEQGYPTPTPRPRPIEVLMMAAAQTIVQPAAAPAPITNFAASASHFDDRVARKPIIEPKANLAFAQMTIEPVAAPVPQHNFAQPPSPVRDALDTELELDLVQDVVVARVAERAQPIDDAKDNFLVALRDGIAAHAEGLLAWPAQWISSAENLIWRGGSSKTFAETLASAPLGEAKEPFPPITDEDAAELEVIIAALRSRARYDAQSARQSRPTPKSDRLGDIRARKGDLILTAPLPRLGADSTALVPVSAVAVRTSETLLPTGKSAE